MDFEHAKTDDEHKSKVQLLLDFMNLESALEAKVHRCHRASKIAVSL